ncbi:hypothetical protein D3C81_1504660 [compost metagenome]
MAADKKIFELGFFRDRLAQVLGVKSSGHVECIAKAQMYATLRGQVGTRHLGLAVSRHFWFHRTKGQVGDQVGVGINHFSASPGDQHLLSTDRIEKLGVTFWRLSLGCI